MLDKNYLDKFSSEKKRLTPVKVELSSIADLEKAVTDMSMAESMLEEFSVDGVKTVKLIGYEFDTADDIMDKTIELKLALKTLIEKLEADYNELYDAQNSAYGYLEANSKINGEFVKNAKALGIDPKDVPTFNDFHESIDELMERTKQSEGTIESILMAIETGKDFLNKFK